MSNLVNNRMAATQSISRLIEKSKNARKGFTVLELLVASLLLGMLMTILTMIFNQSSIAWRTGEASVQNMDYAREDISDIRVQADNFYEWQGEHYVQSVFGDDGNVRTVRKGANGYINDSFVGTGNLRIDVPPKDSTDAKDSYKNDRSPRRAANGDSDKPYVVNVMSWGPDGREDTRYDNIYSVSPTDNPNEW